MQSSVDTWKYSFKIKMFVLWQDYDYVLSDRGKGDKDSFFNKWV